MRKIRIGNDIRIQWAIYADGEPYILAGEDLTLYLVNPATRKLEVTDFTVTENRIAWSYAGKDQRLIGVYQLILIRNAGKAGMMTVDVCNAFELVLHSCMIGCADDCGIKTETVNLESEVVLGGSSVDMETLNEILNACCSLDFNEDFNNDFTIGL